VLGRKSKDADPAALQEDATGPYRVVLQAVGPKKIFVIKEMRALTNPHMDLARAKALVDAADASPQVVLRFEDQARAEEAAAQFGRAGATAVVVEGDAVLAPVSPMAVGTVVTSFTCPFCATVSSGSHCDNCGAPRRSP
jgi:ribosomal protein L7/L12